LERPETGKLAVSGDVQSFHYAPNEDLKKELLRKWLTTPPVFAQLLEQYEGGLPSDPTIRYDLIQQGFKPGTAESILKAFKESVEFAKYYEDRENTPERLEPSVDRESDDQSVATSTRVPESVRAAIVASPTKTEADRIPVRLDKRRRAWLEIPTPFYEADKQRLKAQIDLLLTDDEGEDNSAPDTD
jgi:hypothetical protein